MEANSPGAKNTEAVQEALFAGAARHDNVPISSLPEGCADRDDAGHRFGWPVVRLDGVDPPQALSFADLLEVLGLTADEFIAVCHKPADGAFSTAVVIAGHAADAVASLPTRSCVWFTPNATVGPARSNQGRGREREVTRLVALYADLDVKPGVFDDIAQAWEFIAVLSAIIGTRPTAVIFSGHGLQPIWVIEDGLLGDEVQWARAYRLIRRFGRLCTSAARSFCGANLDNVFNMDRLLRVPGTLNLKEPGDPVMAGAVADTGGPLTMEGIEEFLEAYGATELESDQPVAGEVVLPPDEWKFAEHDCNYVQVMVSAWNQESDRPKKGRHQWAMDKAVRLAAACRWGCLTEDGLIVALEYLEDALTHWCSIVGAPRPLHHNEIGSAFGWGINKVATFTDERAGQELGSHRHRNRANKAVEAAATADVGSVSDLESGPLEDGAALLDGVLQVVRRYVVFPDEHAFVAATLWVAATHGINVWNAAPRLVINSPQKRCGKTRAMDVLAGMSHRPLVTVNATSAAVFRSLNGERPPTLFLDEADTVFGTKRAAEQNEDLRALLNAGHQRGRPALRCVGPQQTPMEFPTFAMAALAGIGSMPDTVTDRAVNITMRRRMLGEQVAQYRIRRDEPILHGLRERLAVWVQGHADVLTNAEPDMPVEDRAADTWEPLIAVADAAGGRWPDLARQACTALVEGAENSEEDQSLQIKLLNDIRRIFAEEGVDFLPSSELAGRLRAVAESPWGEWELTANRLARHLSPFGVRPGHNPEKTQRGYRLDHLRDAFERYTRPDPSDPSETSVTTSDSRDGRRVPDGSTVLHHADRPSKCADGRRSRTGRTDAVAGRPRNSSPSQLSHGGDSNER